MISFRGERMSPNMTGFVFAERRFARIVPLMWLAILSYAALRILGRGSFFLKSYLRALALFPAWDVQPNQIWTLRHEVIFYTVFAISFLVWPRRGWILVCWAALPIGYAALMLPIYPSGFFGQFLRIVASPVNIEFFAGFLIGILWHKRTKNISVSITSSPYIIFAIYMIFIMAISHICELGFESVSSTLISSILWSPLLVAGVHMGKIDNTLDRFGKLLGNASYSIYLFHPHFVSAILGVWAKLAHQTPISVVVVGTIIIATALCIFVHLYFERPLLIVSRRLIERLSLSARVKNA